MATMKVLVIEDNPVIVRMNESLLRANGYEVICATDGAEGLKKAREEAPDIILLDIILPQMHGFEVCRHLREGERTKRIPVVLMTGTGLDEIAKNEPDIAADAYLSKPYGIQELEAAIRQATAKRKGEGG